MLTISQYIIQHELKPLRKYFELNDILEGAEKVLKNLAIETKSPVKLSGFKFFKVVLVEKQRGG